MSPERRRSLVLVAAAMILMAVIAAWQLLGHPDRPIPAVRLDPVSPPAPQQEPAPAAAAAALPAWAVRADMPARVIAGTVFRDGRPAAGASVVLSSMATQAGLLPASTVVTGADGRFSFGPQPAAEYQVHAFTASQTRADTRVDLRLRSPEPAPDRLELHLGRCAWTIHGVVRDVGGGVIAGARIATSEQYHVLEPPVLTSEDGSYELCVRRGMVTVSIEAAGYGRVEAPVRSWRGRLDAALSPASTLAGVVRSPDGGLAPRAAVYVVRGAPSDFDHGGSILTTSDDEGRFELEIAPGPLTVRAWTDRAATDPALLEIAPGEVRTVELALTARPELRGRALRDGAPAAEVELFFRASLDILARVVTAADGTFTAVRLRAGTILIGSTTHRVVAPDRVDLPAGGRSDVEIEVVESGRVRGRVVRQGAPVAGAVIHASRRFPRPPHATSDLSGTFTISGLSLGSHTFEVANADGTARASPLEIEITDATMVDLGDIELSPVTTVSGRVVAEDGAAVATARIQLARPGGGDEASTSTDQDGSFTLEVIGVGRYEYEVDKMIPLKTREPHQGIVIRHPGPITGEVVMVQIETGTISGRLVDASGKGVADVVIQARVVGGLTIWAFVEPAAVTGSDGSFRIARLVKGPYDLRAVAPGGRDEAIIRAETGQADVRITLPGPRAL